MKPGVKTIITGISLLVLGVIIVPIAILAIILPMVIGDAGKAQFEAPGSTQVEVTKKGRYYVWNDYRTVFDGRRYNRSESIPDGINIVIKERDTGERLNFVSDSSISSTSGSSAKNSIGYIQVKRPGMLDIHVTGGYEKRIFSFARSNLLIMIGLIAGGSILALPIGFAGIGILIWGIIKRSKAT
jgi:hypothetical protein